MVHLSRIAEDFILLTSEEFGFFDLADRSATGSSMMPQKKNPDPLELVRGKAGRAIGHLTGLLTTMKGLPTGYNKNLQEDKEPIFDSEDTLDVCLEATRAVIAHVSLRADKTRTAASGLLLATDVADYLALNADTLSRIMSSLRQRGLLVQSSRGRILVPVWEGLRALTPIAGAIATRQTKMATQDGMPAL